MQKGGMPTSGPKDSASRYDRVSGPRRPRQSVTGVYESGSPDDQDGPNTRSTMLSRSRQRTLGRASLLGGGEV